MSLCSTVYIFFLIYSYSLLIGEQDGAGGWRLDGVLTNTKSSTETIVECQSTHLTNFAVIFVEGDSVVQDQVRRGKIATRRIKFAGVDLAKNIRIPLFTAYAENQKQTFTTDFI